MPDLPLTYFDLAVLGVVLVSTIIAFARGFVREFLSVSAFIAAALAALTATPAIVPTVRDVIPTDWLDHLVVVMVVFMTVFVGVTMITHSLTSMLHSSDKIGMVDRILGLAFGAARGALLAALFLIIYNAVTPPRPWITESASYPLVAYAARAVQTLAHDSAPIAANPVPAPEPASEG